MHSKIKRTVEEIDERIAESRNLAESHPYSMVGDDNVANYEWEKEILDRVKDGLWLNVLENEANDTTDDEEYSNYTNLIYWLEGGK